MDILKTIDSDTVEIGMLPNHPANYIIRSTGQDKTMFTVSYFHIHQHIYP